MPVTILPHAIEQAKKRNICLPLIRAIADSKYPSAYLKGKTEVMVYLSDGTELVIKFMNTKRREVITTYIRDVEQSKSLAKERDGHGLPTEKVKVHNSLFRS